MCYLRCDEIIRFTSPGVATQAIFQIIIIIENDSFHSQWLNKKIFA